MRNACTLSIHRGLYTLFSLDAFLARRKSRSKTIFFRSLKKLFYFMLSSTIAVRRLKILLDILYLTFFFLSFSLELVESFFPRQDSKFHGNFFVCLFSSIVLSNRYVLSVSRYLLFSVSVSFSFQNSYCLGVVISRPVL